MPAVRGAWLHRGRRRARDSETDSDPNVTVVIKGSLLVYLIQAQDHDPYILGLDADDVIDIFVHFGLGRLSNPLAWQTFLSGGAPPSSACARTSKPAGSTAWWSTRWTVSRSLLDFARIMESFDSHKVSFVSVTQQFNTTSSMGRLTLNILLSFAQFEREIISERTKDKMAAARRKGKWVGGQPVLGYDIDPKRARLVVNSDEASQVRAIYDLYLEHQAAIPVVQELAGRGWVTKRWTTKKGRETGGKPFTKNALYRLLTNVHYTGKVRYEGTLYEGEHDAIVDAEVWQRVQETLRRNGLAGGRGVRNKYGALLRGLLYCAPCESGMVHTYTRKGRKRYRYYVCHNAQQRGWSRCLSKSPGAHDIETAVVEHIRGIGCNDAIVQATVEKVREQSDRRMAELEVERLGRERELKQLYSSLETLVRSSDSDSSNGRSTTDLLADLQDRIRRTEQRVTATARRSSRWSGRP